MPRCSGSRTNSATASSRFGSGSSRPTSMLARRPGCRRLSVSGYVRWKPRFASCAESTILEAAASFFGAARPPIEALIEFIDREKVRFGVEPICRVLSAHDCKIAPSTYYARKTRPVSRRAQQDALWVPVLLALWTLNYRVYGAHKLWKAALRDGHQIGRDQVARLMRTMQIKGATRMRRVRTTIRDDSNPRSPDLVKRDFTAQRPNRLWLTDITCRPGPGSRTCASSSTPTAE